MCVHGLFVCLLLVCFCVYEWCVCVSMHGVFDVYAWCVFVCVHGLFVCLFMVCWCVCAWCVCVFIHDVLVCLYMICDLFYQDVSESVRTRKRASCML